MSGVPSLKLRNRLWKERVGKESELIILGHCAKLLFKQQDWVHYHHQAFKLFLKSQFYSILDKWIQSRWASALSLVWIYHQLVQTKYEPKTPVLNQDRYIWRLRLHNIEQQNVLMHSWWSLDSIWNIYLQFSVPNLHIEPNHKFNNYRITVQKFSFNNCCAMWLFQGSHR